MSKYSTLSRYLSEQDADLIPMTFAEVATLVAGGLPGSAYEHRPWWANRYDGNGSQNQGWQSVGWESSEVNMDNQSVTFKRVIKKRTDFKDVPFVKEITIGEAKQGLALKFNVDPKSIDIVIRG